MPPPLAFQFFGSLVQLAGPQSPKSTRLTFEVDIV
jgi:hypothetical protein